MKKLFIIIIILLLFSVMVSAKLSKETLEKIEELRFKYYWYGLNLINIDDDTITNYGNCNFIYEWTAFWFEDGKLFVETQNGEWFIEMKEIKKGDD